MKKIFKKAVVATTAAAMVLGSAMTALAAEVQIQAGDIVKGAYGELGNPNEQRHDDATGLGQAGLGVGDNVANKDTAGYEVTINVDAEGEYALRFCYVAKTGSAKRKFSYQIDGGNRVDVELDPTADWNNGDKKIYEVPSAVSLTKGEHKIKLACSTDYDNSTVKAPNIIYVAYEAKNVVQPADPDNNTPNQSEETTAAPENNNPPTGDTSAVMLFAVLAVVSAAGVVVFKRKAA